MRYAQKWTDRGKTYYDLKANIVGQEPGYRVLVCNLDE